MQCLLFGFVISLFTLIGCSEKTANVVIEEIDGVKHIHNIAPEWGDEVKIELKYVGMLGEDFTNDVNYEFYNPSTLLKDEDGNIYVLDSGNFRIQKFAPDGKYIMSIGKEGEGPGELKDPADMCFGLDGNIYVVDRDLARAQIFTKDGKSVNTFNISVNISEIHRLRSGNFVLPYYQGYDDQRDINDLVTAALIDKEGNVLKKFGQICIPDDLRLINYLNRVYLAETSAGEILSACFSDNRIEKFSPDGDLLSVIDRELNYEIKSEIEMMEVNIGGGNTVDMGIPRFTFVSTGLETDGSDRLWLSTMKEQPEPEDVRVSIRMDNESEARTLDQGEGKEEDIPFEEQFYFEIFSPDGVLLGTIPPPREFVFFKIIDDSMYLFDQQEMVIHEYRITEK
ncbi:NHL repeat-containing protein [candidate division KSB1 bacterium]